jgi:DNA replication ATP-dependent helicase Dna2
MVASVLFGHIRTVDNVRNCIVIEYVNDSTEEITADVLGCGKLMWKTDSRIWQNVPVHRIVHTSNGAPSYVIQPSYVLDVTEVAGVVTPNGPSLEKIVSRCFRKAESLPATVPGNLINAAFDVLVRHPEHTDEVVLDYVLGLRPLSLASLHTRGELASSIDRVRQMLPRLRNANLAWREHEIELEPYYVSTTFGLQGRADIILRKPEGISIVEMKAGKAPSSGIRADHAAQVSAYYALLSEQHPAPIVSSELWYVQDEAHPFRNLEAPEDHFSRVLAARNAIVAAELAFAHADSSPLRMIRDAKSRSNPNISSYEREEFDWLTNALDQLDATERHAVMAWLTLVARERMEQREGGGRGGEPISGLVLDQDRSDMEHMHLVFKRPHDTSDSPIRVGDAIVLFESPLDGSPLTDPARYKGSVREISNKTVMVSLRNKFAPVRHLLAGHWTMELDVMDSSSKALHAGIRAFIGNSSHKRAILLGRAAPRMKDPVPSTAPNLTPAQRTVVERALGSQDLFLIQGPPGTGKTSAVLRAIIQELVNIPNERVIALAYTNRAANEICAALERHSIDYIRHGSLEGATGEHGIPQLGRAMSADGLAQRISSARCIVATMQSLSSSPEIWDFGTFTTAVVDEASQILEPMLLLATARVQRSILIGDHCQLPAVVTQPIEHTRTSNSHLQAINLTTTSMSAFERLLRCAQDHAHVAMLTQQGRMHRDVMAFADEAFYHNKLTCLHQHQCSDDPLPWSSILPHRACFVSALTTQDQITIAVNLATRIVEATPEGGHAPSIGIISPFRIVNNAIIGSLPHNVLDHCTVDTVERFQGGERDVVIYVVAVSTSQELDQIRSEIEYGGSTIDRKLNVALTRAKQQIVMIGDEHMLENSPVYARAIESLHRVAVAL